MKLGGIFAKIYLNKKIRLMKKSILKLSAAVLLTFMFATSCNKEKTDDNTDSRYISFEYGGVKKSFDIFTVTGGSQAKILIFAIGAKDGQSTSVSSFNIAFFEETPTLGEYSLGSAAGSGNDLYMRISQDFKSLGLADYLGSVSGKIKIKNFMNKDQGFSLKAEGIFYEASPTLEPIPNGHNNIKVEMNF